MSHWSYRVIEFEQGGTEPYFEIRTVYWMDGKDPDKDPPTAYGDPGFPPGGGTLDKVEWELKRMSRALAFDPIPEAHFRGDQI